MNKSKFGTYYQIATCDVVTESFGLGHPITPGHLG